MGGALGSTLGSDGFEIAINSIKLLLIFFMMVQAVPILVWVERRGSAFIQNRLGPNRVGPFGLVQLLADAVKFLTKEDFVPEKGIKFLYFLAPVFALIPGAVAYLSIPMSTPFSMGKYTFLVQGYDINIGVVFILGVSSLAAYTILMAGFGSGNKFSLMGALRASAQTISYELALGLSVVGVILLYGTLDLTTMIKAQEGVLSYSFLGFTQQLSYLPNWGIFYQPIGAILFFAATFAESNRLPFDLPEGEAELVAGFHTEYGGFKMLMFFIGEYAHMMIAAGLMTTFFFGGYNIPFISPNVVLEWAQTLTNDTQWATVLTSVIHFLCYNVKFIIFLWIFIHVRWTLPRFRYDQLMDLGWKTMLPWALGNAVITAIFIYLAKGATP